MDEDEIKVGICPHTVEEVLQIPDEGEYTGWLCLHNETPEEDAIEVENFKNKI